MSLTDRPLAVIAGFFLAASGLAPSSAAPPDPRTPPPVAATPAADPAPAGTSPAAASPAAKTAGAGVGRAADAPAAQAPPRRAGASGAPATHAPAKAAPARPAPPRDAEAERRFAEALHERHGLDVQNMLATLGRAQYQQSIIDAMNRPAESKTWKDYRPIFVTPQRLADGIAFYRANRALIERAAAEFQVAPEIIVAILGVETSYGRNAGRYRVIDALYTLAFHYPPRQAFFRDELEQLFVLGDGAFPKPLAELGGSYAGAMGWGQFMPSSIARYARDYDGDGRIDLWNSLPDIVGSVANYFRGYGWEAGGPIATRAQPAEGAREIGPGPVDPVYPVEQLVAWGYAPLVHLDPERAANLVRLDGANGPEFWITFQNFYVITRYNRSPLYAMAVTQLAEGIAAGVKEPAP